MFRRNPPASQPEALLENPSASGIHLMRVGHSAQVMVVDGMQEYCFVDEGEARQFANRLIQGRQEFDTQHRGIGRSKPTGRGLGRPLS